MTDVVSLSLRGRWGCEVLGGSHSEAGGVAVVGGHGRDDEVRVSGSLAEAEAAARAPQVD